MPKSFAQRVLGRPERELQVSDMDLDLRNSVFNAIYFFLFEGTHSQYQIFRNTPLANLYWRFWIHFLKKPVDEITEDYQNAIDVIKMFVLKANFDRVYELIEFLLTDNYRFEKPKFKKVLNQIFERERSGYRIVNNLVAQITSTEEIKEISDALTSSKKSGFVGAKIHLKEALIKLSDRTAPDYRNSFKESVSAIESISQFLANDSKASLRDAFKKIKTKITLHSALEKGFLNIYGYASDDDGIRHALWDESKVEAEDARFMLIAASAFINYLLVKTDKAGLLTKVPDQ